MTIVGEKPKYNQEDREAIIALQKERAILSDKCFVLREEIKGLEGKKTELINNIRIVSDKLTDLKNEIL